MLAQLWEAWLAWCKKWKARLEGNANQAEIRVIRERLERELQGRKSGECLLKSDPDLLTGADRELYLHVLHETKKANRNNVTRTAAYLDVFRYAPELHWAFLAHMVSRNGGYNMTDLQGDLVPRAMESGEAARFFHFLERANFLIFGDAYPQLLLYEASKDQGKPLFHLLPCFGVSTFMQVIWQRFWETRDSELLTLALVVNEQNYIERRVVQHEKYLSVVESFEFRAQTFLNLTQVVFPFRAGRQGKVEVAGVVVDTFLSLQERIDTGRHLYAILFGVPEVQAGALAWATATPHTGSRSDYWPDLYTPQGLDSAQGPRKKYRPRLQDGTLRQGAVKFHSPTLESAWPDVQNPEPPGNHDWCESADAAEELYRVKPKKGWNLTKQYVKSLEWVEKAVAAETWLTGRGK